MLRSYYTLVTNIFVICGIIYPKSLLGGKGGLMHSFKERRKCQRFDVSLPIRFKKMYGDTYLDKNTVTKDLSKNGIRFGIDFPVSLNARLLIEMDLPSYLNPIKVLCRVVWVKKLLASKNYECGNEFLSIKEEDIKAISRYTERLLV